MQIVSAMAESKQIKMGLAIGADTAQSKPGDALEYSAAAGAAAFVIGLGDAPIERAEIYFLDVARAMVERADWLVPYYRGEPFYDKPPLLYWLLATSFDLLGPSLFAGRLVAAPGAAMTAWLGSCDSATVRSACAVSRVAIARARVK